MPKGDTCSIENCNNIVIWGKVCNAHYHRMYRNGTYEILPTHKNLKKGIATLTKCGYLRVNTGKKRVLQHRHIMEQHLGRKLLPSEKVHHKNGIKTDNRIENLELYENQSKHISKNHGNKVLVDWSKINVPTKKVTRWHPHKFNCCIISECQIKPRLRGLCTKHYQSYYKHVLSK